MKLKFGEKKEHCNFGKKNNNLLLTFIYLCATFFPVFLILIINCNKHFFPSNKLEKKIKKKKKQRKKKKKKLIKMT